MRPREGTQGKQQISCLSKTRLEHSAFSRTFSNCVPNPESPIIMKIPQVTQNQIESQKPKVIACSPSLTTDCNLGLWRVG